MVKKIFDAGVSICSIWLWGPIFFLIAFLVKKHLDKPFFFRQKRPGKNGVPFEMIKFRTMRNAFGADGKPLPDEQRMTRFGRFLRSTSLDELPELINVLRGEMSLVGPRPLLMEYLSLYDERQMRRHDVLPGITGWAQVNGRNAISWQQKFELDLWYVENQSFRLDLKILWMTFWQVISRQGISQEGRATVEPFNGKN
ncbi:MAG: sugar transferase [Candidatus Riflebacteria bacterium]